MLIRVVVFIIFILFIAPLNSHAEFTISDSTKVNYYIKAGDKFFESKKKKLDSLALKEYLSAIDILNHQSQLSDLNVKVNLRCASVFYWYKDFNSALDYYKRALSIQENLPNNTESLLSINKKIGQVFWNLGEIDSAFFYYSEAEVLSDNYPHSKTTADLYGFIGLLYFETGNFIQGLNYSLRYLEIYENYFPSYKKAIYRAKNNIATIYKRLEKYDRSLEIYKEIIDQTDRSKNDVRIAETFVILYQNLGTVYNEVDKFEEAIKFIKRGIDNHNFDESSNSRLSVRLYENLGTSYQGLGKVDSAMKYFDKAIIEYNKYFPYKNVLFANILMKKALLLNEMNLGKEAKDEIQEAIKTVIINFNNPNFKVNPKYPFQTLSDLETFRILVSKAEIIEKFNENNDSETSKLVLDTYQLALQLAEKIRKSYDSDEAKIFFQNNVYPVFEESIRVALQLFEHTQDEKYKHLAFQFSEQSKAAVLEESIKNHEIKGYTGIPKELLVQERDLKIQLSKVKSRLANANDQEKIDKYTLQLADLEIELGKVIKSFEAYPNYYALKYANNEVNLEEFQKRLQHEDKALLEYFWGEKEIIGFLVSGKNFLIRRFPLDSGLINNIDQYYTAYKTYSPGEPFGGHQSGYEIYNKIFEPFEKELSKYKKLVIIPDGKLNYLPFDALKTEPHKDFYLIEKYIISQSYSGKLWLDAQKINNSGNNEILAIAPFAKDVALGYVAFRDKYFSPLPATRQEVKGISNHFYINEEATKNRFLDEYQNYNILHFATHAEVNEEEPSSSYITFFPKGEDAEYRLYVHEMYNLNFDSTKLVVLSGCETGSGQFQRGEGIMSLARAIAYAGCPNIIMTLWRAEDKSTSFIAQKMYQYLEDGKPKDEALRQAKLDYLHSDEFFKIDKTPVHWANFIVIGNADPIASLPIYKQIYFWVSLALIVGAVLMFLKRKGSKTFA
ncbi:CHAT domain-containing protein [Flexithrix dorotheae]|uniref:CHAT domain-containing protein n=1 Tax=Flexithrix dorotheae TaxID=70993 RepID=UPI00035DBC02|nr:CHAT domain-containing tetratricopeptide repeat protein [Flexithrix dorotheae]